LDLLADFYSMGCKLAKEHNQGRVESKQFDKRLKYDQSSQRKEVKILMLGTGDSGKSTVLKQLKFINGGGYSAEKRFFFKRCIFNNIVQSMQAILEAMDVFGIPFANDTTASHHAQRDML